MLTTIKGVYDHGKIILNEKPPVEKKSDVIVTFLSGEQTEDEQKTKRGKPGALKGRLTIPDDFNEPLEDLKEYM